MMGDADVVALRRFSISKQIGAADCGAGQPCDLNGSRDGSPH
jgi:hypothetical protein